MNTPNGAGAAYDALGTVEGVAGDVLGNGDLKRSGAANKVKAAARKAQAKVEDKVHTLADQVASGVSTLADRGVDVYGRTATKAREVAGRVEPMVKERPLAATGVALGVGVALGLLLAAGRTKVVYVRPRD